MSGRADDRSVDPVAAETGFGFWLGLFIAGLLVVGPVLNLAFLVPVLMGSDEDPQWLRQSAVLPLYALLTAIISVFSIYSGLRLRQRQPEAPDIARAYLVIALVFGLISSLQTALYVPSGLWGTADTIRLARRALSTVVFFAIWYPYLGRSKRVRTLYGPPGSRWPAGQLDAAASLQEVTGGKQARICLGATALLASLVGYYAGVLPATLAWSSAGKVDHAPMVRDFLAALPRAAAWLLALPFVLRRWRRVPAVVLGWGAASACAALIALPLLTSGQSWSVIVSRCGEAAAWAFLRGCILMAAILTAWRIRAGRAWPVVLCLTVGQCAAEALFYLPLLFKGVSASSAFSGVVAVIPATVAQAAVLGSGLACAAVLHARFRPGRVDADIGAVAQKAGAAPARLVLPS